MNLREYQTEAIECVLAAWGRGVRSPAVVLPTGAGKTVIFAELCARLVAAGERPVVLVNRDELVRQSVAKLRDANPDLTVGVVQAGRNDLRGHVVVASIQTLSRARRLAHVPQGRFTHLVVDEAHYAAADSWRRVLDHFNAPTVGFTATMERTDKRGLGEIWDEVVFKRSTRWAIQEGYLVPVRAQTVVIPELDLSSVKISQGDLADGDLGRAMAQAKAGPLIAQAYNELARNEAGELRRGICFAPTIEVAENFLLDFRDAGIPTELVIGTTPTAERQAKYAATRAGDNRVLMSVGVLTTGFDEPTVEVAIVARPTKSRGLYQQMIGRALRLSPDTGKHDALILDVVGASRLGLSTLVDLRLDEPATDKIEDDEDLDERGSIIIPKVAPETPDEIEFKEVDPFDGTDVEEVAARKTLARRTSQTTMWDITEGGIPFLPPSETFLAYVALRKLQDGSWEVWRVPQGSGTATLLEARRTLAEAMLVAHETRGSILKLAGMASEGQIRFLWRLQVEFDEENLTKQDASKLINRKLASRRLDR